MGLPEGQDPEGRILVSDAVEIIRGPVAGADCASCPFAVDGKPAHDPVRGIGPAKDPRFIILGEGPGGNEVRLGVPFCLVPETLVLMADLTWKPLGDVEVGTQIITIDENAVAGAPGVSGHKARGWVVATVTAKYEREAETLRIGLDDGELIGTPDHRVLRTLSKNSTNKRWLRLDQLTRGVNRQSHLVFIGRPWERDMRYEAAYLAGFFDGEGHVLGSKGRKRAKRAGVVGFSQNVGPTHDRACEYVRACGFELRVAEKNTTVAGVTCMRQNIAGGFVASLRFLGTVRPERLITNLRAALEAETRASVRVQFQRSHRSAVRSREPAGVRRVIDITTTAGTFIANGFVAHNCGPAGELLDKALSRTGTDRKQLYVANATACIPRGENKDEKVRQQAATACSGRLRNELAMFPGRPILAMGNVAMRAVIGDLTGLPITKVQGCHFETDLDGTGVRSIITTVHPVAILRGGGKEGKGDKGPEKTGGHTADLAFWDLMWDIIKAGKLGDGKDIRLPMRLGVEIETEVTDAERARWLVRRVLGDAAVTKRLTIDYETYVDDPTQNNALQAFTAKINLVGLAAAGRSVCVRWALLDEETIEDFKAFIADEETTKEYHNGCVYDQAVEGNQHYRFEQHGPVEDTLLGHHAAWPGAPKKLQHAVSRQRAVAPWKSEYRELNEDNVEAEAEYCAKDALATHAYVPTVNFWIKKNQVDRVYDVDRVKARIARIMHEKGYYVDRDVNAECDRRLQAAIDHANGMMHEECAKVWPKFLMVLASEQAKTQRKKDSADYGERVTARFGELEKQLAKDKFVYKPGNPSHDVAFLKAMGVPLWKPTKSGKKISTGADVLEEFGEYPAAAALILLRSNEQLHETFVARMFKPQWKASEKTWMPPHVQADGRVHPLWSPTQISGRYSSKDPPSSNWTMGDETNLVALNRLPNIRRQLVAAPGNGIVAFDAAQLEARTMAVQSGDPFLCTIFRNGLDIHYEFAKLIFPRIVHLDKVADEELFGDLRDQTKRFEYGALYGGALATIQRALVVNKPELAGKRGMQMIEQAVAKLKAAVPGVTRWQQSLLAKLSQPPHTFRSFILGRMRVWPLGSPPPTDVANNPNQFMGDDVISCGLVKFMPLLEKYGGTAFPILHQHDALYVECREADMTSVARDMNAAFPMTVRAVDGKDIDFPIEIKMGYAYHVEPSDKAKAKFPQLVWPCGRPGLKKVKMEDLGL